MGSIISKIYDDYDDYKELCKKFDREPKDIPEFYKDAKEITKSLSKEERELLEKGYLCKFL